MISPGSHFLDFVVGPKMGQGAFGEIYSCIDQKTGIFWAIKTESEEAKRKTLEFEYQVLSRIQSSPYFPRLGIYGQGLGFNFYSLELLGPSLNQILKNIPDHRFSFSTAIRTCYHVLKGIEAFHLYGFIHRDIKPSNILIREGFEYPLCLIDFGLSKFYIDTNTGKQFSQRNHVGFRGTKLYASIFAHQGCDLSRRDDLISWFYLSLELLTGFLPWKGLTSKNEIFELKTNFDYNKTFINNFPELKIIWKYISLLQFYDIPNYNLLYTELLKAFERNSVNINDQYDWSGFLHSHRNKVIQSINCLNSHIDIPFVKYKNNYKNEHLLDSNYLIASPFSHISEEEICCCKC